MKMGFLLINNENLREWKIAIKDLFCLHHIHLPSAHKFHSQSRLNCGSIVAEPGDHSGFEFPRFTACFNTKLQLVPRNPWQNFSWSLETLTTI